MTILQNLDPTISGSLTDDEDGDKRNREHSNLEFRSARVCHY